MKRWLTMTVIALLAIGAEAQTMDAFSGVLPVTDTKMKMSLNGEWQLKVIEGITDDQPVPEGDYLPLVPLVLVAVCPKIACSGS